MKRWFYDQVQRRNQPKLLPLWVRVLIVVGVLGLCAWWWVTKL